MINDELNREQVSLAAKVGKLTFEEIKKAIEKLHAMLKNNKLNIPTVKHGKQSLKELAAQNSGLSSLELKNPDLRQLNREMKKCSIDFSPQKTGKGEYLLFFKGKDADAMTFAFERYTKKLMKQERKPSIRKMLSDFKKKAAELNAGRDKVKNKSKGGHEH